MLNGIYTAASGLMMEQKRVDVIANNLANVDTHGYKKDTPVFSQYLANAGKTPDDLIRSSDYNKMINATSRLDSISTSYEMGDMQETGRNLDFALTNPNSYFAVDTPFGVRFTRNGDFTIDSDGQLATQEGYKVLSSISQPQYITIPTGAYSVTDTGDIMVNKVATDKIATAEFPDTTKLQKMGNSLFAAVDTIPADSQNPGLETGYLEGSNVNPIQEMVRMIEANRSFETYQKVVQTLDDISNKAVNSVGSLS